jgi:hypothetical protein
MELLVTEKAEDMLSFAERLEKELSANLYMVICVKHITADIDDFPFSDLHKYLTDNNILIKYASYGQHLQGQNKIPHVHYNLITEPFNFKSMTQNSSQHRKRWYDKQTEIEPDFLKLSFKFHAQLDDTKPKYSTLSYPLKEGLHIYTTRRKMYTNVSQEMFNFLLNVGTDIYNKEVGLHQRQDKCEIRKQCALSDLATLCNQNKSNFGSFREMQLWLDINYIDKLDLLEYPDPKNYKTNLQKIAIKLKFLKYSDL